MNTTTKPLHITRIRFPEIQLRTRDAHKLRGYFGNLFKEESPMLHNHWETGEVRYRYPQVQYKIIDEVPMLVGIEEGAELLSKLFLKIKEIEIDGQIYPVHSKNIESQVVETGYSDTLKEYQFQTLWMALNQKNYKIYQRMTDEKEKQQMLNSILIGHILSFFRNMEIELNETERLMAKVNVVEKFTNFKGNKMLAFTGSFLVNATLPDFIGIGKSASRGFGAVIEH